jgi:hypothetical protein
VVLQPGTHGGGVDDHRDAVPPQVVGRADPRQHQQLWGLDRPAGDDDLAGRAGFAPAPVADVADPPRPAALEEHPADVRAGLHGDIRPPHGRPEVGVSGGPASPRSLGHLIVTNALLLSPVEVLVARQPRRHRRLQPRPAQRMLIALVLHPQRPLGAVIGGVAPLLVLGPQEVGQQVDVAPAGAAVAVAPGVVVDPVAANVDHAVDRRAAPEHPPTGPWDPPLARVPLRHGHVIPGQRPIPQRRRGSRQGDLGNVIRRSALEHQNAGRQVLTQPTRDHAPRAAGADHDVVIHEHLHGSSLPHRVSRRGGSGASPGVHVPCLSVHQGVTTRLSLHWWSFSRSFHQALLQPTRPHWAESRPNLSCLDPTGTVRAEYGQLSPK